MKKVYVIVYGLGCSVGGILLIFALMGKINPQLQSSGDGKPPPEIIKNQTAFEKVTREDIVNVNDEASHVIIKVTITLPDNATSSDKDGLTHELKLFGSLIGYAVINDYTCYDPYDEKCLIDYSVKIKGNTFTYYYAIPYNQTFHLGYMFNREKMAKGIIIGILMPYLLETPSWNEYWSINNFTTGCDLGDELTPEFQWKVISFIVERDVDELPSVEKNISCNIPL
jgi:hypothetical protein